MISSLLPELVADIFIRTIPDVSHYPWQNDHPGLPPGFSLDPGAGYLSPIFLSSVCKSWREIALTTPRLWSLVVIDAAANSGRNDPTMGLDNLETWIRRSGSIPLTFVYLPRDGTDSTAFVHVLRAMFAHVQRWQTLYLRCDVQKITGAHLTPSDFALANPTYDILIPLQAIFVSILPVEPGGDQLQHYNRVPQFLISRLESILSSSPRLRLVNLFSGDYSNVDWSFSLYEEVVETPIFRSLSELNISLASLTSALALLQSAPNLADISLKVRDSMFELSSAFAESYTPITLRQLRRLRLAHPDVLGVSSVLNRITAPSLYSLSISSGDPHPHPSPESRDSYSSFMLRSQCDLRELGLALIPNMWVDLSQTWTSPFLAEIPLGHSLTHVQLGPTPPEGVIQLLSTLPNLEDISIILFSYDRQSPLEHLPGHPFTLQNLRVFNMVPAQCTKAQISIVLDHINAPSLENISIRNPLRTETSIKPTANPSSLKAFISRKSASLRHFGFTDTSSTVLEEDNTSDDLLWYLSRLGEPHDGTSLLESLVLDMPADRLISHRVVQLLTIPVSGELYLSKKPHSVVVGAGAFPALKRLALLDVCSQDGEIANMVRSRFEHSDLQLFRCSFRLSSAQSSMLDAPQMPIEQASTHRIDMDYLTELALAQRQDVEFCYGPASQASTWLRDVGESDFMAFECPVWM